MMLATEVQEASRFQESLAHVDAVYRVARHLARDARVAEALVEEAYARAQRGGAADVDGARPASLLFRAMRAAWLDRHAEPPCVRSIDGDVPAALAALGCDAQLAVLLDLEGLTAREIGDVLACAPDAARSRLGDARTKLWELLRARR